MKDKLSSESEFREYGNESQVIDFLKKEEIEYNKKLSLKPVDPSKSNILFDSIEAESMNFLTKIIDDLLDISDIRSDRDITKKELKQLKKTDNNEGIYAGIQKEATGRQLSTLLSICKNKTAHYLGVSESEKSVNTKNPNLAIKTMQIVTKLEEIISKKQ